MDNIEFQDIDGGNNNLVNPTWGQTGTRFVRKMLPRYDDGISSVDANLPNPRNISNKIMGIGPFSYNSYELAAMKSAWGQLIAHDVALTLPHTPEERLDIRIPCCDAKWDALCTCNVSQAFKRTAYDNSSGTSSSNPRVQVNAQTGFIDASAVYGATVSRMVTLRTFSHGKLKYDPDNGVPMNTEGFVQFGPVMQQCRGSLVMSVEM